MIKSYAALLLSVVALCACTPGVDAGDSEQAVVKFHQLLDAGSFEDIYAQAAPELRVATDKDQFIAELTAVHQQFGDFQSSDQVSSRLSASNNGNFVELGYRATFKNGQGVEAFRFRTDRGTPQLMGYKFTPGEPSRPSGAGTSV